MIEGGQIAVVNFPMGHGGKFIQNILALSRHCVIKHSDWAQWQLNKSWEPEDYNKKLGRVLRTLPAVGVPMNNWLSYELRDDLFFNGIINSDHSGQFPNHVYAAAAQGLWITYTSHHCGNGKNCEKYWPRVRYINLRADEFAARWLPQKNQRTEHHELWRDYDPIPGGFDFDLDRCLYDFDLFSQSIKEIFQYLEWDDFESIPLAPFYQAYIKLHPK